jgi:hypothetical protein
MVKALKFVLIISIFSLFLHFPQEVYSQITISSSDVLGLIGKSQSAEFDTSGSVIVNVGSAGANQTWDFGSVSIEPTVVTWEFLSPGGTPFESDFPQSNFVWKMTFPQQMGFTFYNYSEVTSSRFSTLGSGIVTPDTSFKQSDADDIAPLPLTFGDSWTSTEVDSFGDPQTFGQISTTTTANTVDAWGTVLLPIGNFDCLRIRGDNTEISQTFIGGQETSRDTTNTIEYIWISKNNFVVVLAESQEGDTNPNFTDASSFFRLSATPTDVKDQADNTRIPSNFVLFDNYPNPFNPETMIKYQLSQNAHVELAIFNLLGQKVRVLVDGAHTTGSYEVRWDGTDDFGNQVSSGIYVYRLKAAGFTDSKKMVLLQ